MTVLSIVRRIGRCQRLGILTAIVVALLSMGCTPTLEYLRVDSSLSYAGMAEGRMAVMPVGASTDTIRNEELAQMQHHLMGVIRSNRGGIGMTSLTTVNQIRKEMGGDDAVATFTATGGLPPPQIQALSTALQARYVAFAVLSMYSHHTFDSSESERKTNSKGKVVSTTDYTLRNHSAALSGGLTIYDGQTGLAVWDGRHSVSKTNTNKYRDPKGLIENIVEAAAGDGHTYPPAPLPNELSKILFRAMVLNFPEPED